MQPYHLQPYLFVPEDSCISLHMDAIFCKYGQMNEQNFFILKRKKNGESEKEQRTQMR